MVPLRGFHEPPPTSDPDNPRFEYGNRGGRWEAAAGIQAVLFGLRSAHVEFALAGSGLIQLINFRDVNPVPWESWRAVLGFNTIWSFPGLDRRLPDRGRLVLELGFFHESDHASDVGSYVARFTTLHDESIFDNSNFSSFEFFKLRASYDQWLWKDRLRVTAAFGVRPFTPPIDQWSRRELRLGVNVEGRLAVRIKGNLHGWFALYYEAVLNDFDAGRNSFRGDLDGDPLHYLRLELGLEWTPTTWMACVPFISYSNSHGRGVDFPVRRSEAGGGLRWFF